MSTPATVEIWESNGGVPTTTKATSISLGSIDSPNLVPIDHPLVIPAAGFVYSYKKWTRWNVISWVDTTTIDNFKWFKSTGVAPAGGWLEHFAGNHDPAYSVGRSNYGADDAQPWPTLTIGGPFGVDGTFTNPATGFSKYAAFVLSIDNSTLPGNKGIFTITYRYDES